MYINFEELRGTFYGDDFEEYLEYLLENGEFENEDRDKGIIRKVLEDGYESLSEKQQNCFDFGVIKNNYDECELCGEFINWYEVKMMLIEGENYCSAHSMDKMD